MIEERERKGFFLRLVATYESNFSREPVRHPGCLVGLINPLGGHLHPRVRTEVRGQHLSRGKERFVIAPTHPLPLHKLKFFSVPLLVALD